jgi:hypothetical protein
MSVNGILKTCIYAIFIAAIVFVGLRPSVAANPQGRANDCIKAAAERTQALRALPARTHLQTLDGKNVLIKQFVKYCYAMFPWCGFFEKFYYWENEIKEIVSVTPAGMVKHRVRCYHNCLSTCCPARSDPLKTHGDVAEFYDDKGRFMGLAVYMGNGKYCSLPYRGDEQPQGHASNESGPGGPGLGFTP